MSTLTYLILGVAAIPFIYYMLAIYSTWRFLGQTKPLNADSNFTPPVSILKPVKGADPDAYENFASYCRQNYPQYEILFCTDANDPMAPVIEKLKADFPKCNIRVLYGSGRNAINDKVARLVRLTTEAHYDLFVITDADVRVEPNYLRSVVAPFSNPKLGAATCFYASIADNTFLELMQSVGMVSDFFAGILVAWKLDGVKFALAQTIVTTRQNIAGFGGYEALEDRPADDLYIGRFASEQGYDTQLLRYTVGVVPDFDSWTALFRKRLRWMTVMRHMRPGGHFGLIFTWGLPWSLFAVAFHPTFAVAAAFLGTYAALRIAMTTLIGNRVMGLRGLWPKMLLFPVWDLMALLIWLTSFLQTTIRWRGVDYLLRDGKLTSSSPATADGAVP